MAIAVTDMGASGSDANTTGAVSGAVVTLADAIDIKDGHGVIVDHAGPACTLATPTAPTLQRSTTGSTTYGYRVAAITRHGGVSVPSAETTITDAPDTLSLSTGWVVVSWSAVAGADGYAIYSDSVGAWSLRAIVLGGGVQFMDLGQPGPNAYPSNVPRTLPTAATNEHHITRVVNGGGTTTITLDDAAPNGGSGLRVGHDDTRAINDAILRARSDGRDLHFPAGTYCISENLAIQGPRANGMTIYGDGRTLTTLQDTSVEQDSATEFGGLLSITEAEGVTIRDMTIRGQSGTGAHLAKKGVYLSPKTTTCSATVLRVDFAELTGEACYAEGNTTATFADCHARNCKSNAFNLNAAVSVDALARLSMSGCVAEDCLGASLLAGGAEVRVRDCTFSAGTHNGADVVNLAGCGYLSFTDSHITGCSISGFGVSPIRLGFPNGSSNYDMAGHVRNVVVRGNWTSTEGNGLGGSILLQNCRGPIVIENCIVSDNGRAGGTNHAIEIEGAETGMVVVRDNTIASDGQTTVGVVIRASANTGSNADITAEGNVFSSDIDSADHVIIET